MPDPALMTQADIARALEVRGYPSADHHQLVKRWVQRGKLPDPDERTARGSPLWWPTTVKPWLDTLVST